MTSIVVKLNPVLLELGPLQVRWYGLMYVVGFIITGLLLRVLIKDKIFKVDVSKVDSLITHQLIGMFLGARIVYVFVYNWDYYSSHFGEILSVWKGGLSFHGAIIGLACGAYIFARKNKIHFLQVCDVSVTAGCQGIFWGRMGNFINGELYGRASDVPWAMIFPNGGPYPRHPSQLYEGILEGVILFLILWSIRKRVKVYGVLTSVFLSAYALFRFIVEFFREADSQLGLYFGDLFTMGQILCFLMFWFGVGFYFYTKKRPVPIY